MPDPDRSKPLPLDPQAWLAAIVASSDDAIVSKTLEGIVTSWNKGAERIFGYTSDEIVGKPMTTIFPPDRWDEEPEILRRIQLGERVDHFETIRRRKSGELIEVSVTISPVRDATGKIVGASKIAREIGQQKRIERELRLARDEAEAANRAKDHFLSILSHELRTPLTPVLAAVSLIESGAITAEDLHAHIEMIRRNIETEARLVDDLLDVTRISRGKVQLHCEVIDAHVAIRNVVSMLQTEIDIKVLDVTLGLRAKNRHVWADPGRFQQVLLNLLSNAVKFTPAHGTITIRTGDADGGQLEIQVSDTGVGIDADTLPRLFNAFEQGEQTITRRFGGLGLGLSIARSLLELHGGDITASSPGTGHGATFTCHLPTATETQTSGRGSNDISADEHEGLERLRILLVEDHSDTREMITLLLRSCGCDVTTAASVREAVDLSDRNKFDLLLSDMGLPDGSGIDVMRHMRQRQEIKGIALSGFGQEEDLRRSRDAGFTEHLIKPINLQTLSEVIRDVAR